MIDGRSTVYLICLDEVVEPIKKFNVFVVVHLAYISNLDMLSCTGPC